ncbi:hypothetical protein MK489_07445 [Myxococcota bacterium]|nr:hypothetical protein [Myxococcota bacterium]
MVAITKASAVEDRTSLTRRGFVRGIALVSAGMGLGMWSAGCRRAPAGALELALELSDPASAPVLGRAYLRLHPGENDPRALAQALFPGLATAPGEFDGSRAAREYLERIRVEFASGETVRVGGWVLARSEARLCALTTWA